MSKQGRLMKTTLILFVGILGTKLINFITLPFYTKWLSVAEYGIIDVFTAIVSLCVPILTLQLDQAVFRFMIDDETLPERQNTVSSGLGGMLCILLGIGLPVMVVFLVMKQWLYALYLLAIGLQCCYTLFQQIVRGKGENHVYTINSILLAFITVLFTVLLIRVFPLGVEGYVSAFCIAHLAALVFMLFKAKIHKLFRLTAITFRKLKELLCYSIPMIVNNVSWWILNLSDKLVLNLYLGVSANGIYAAAGKIPGLVTTVFSVFQMAWQESASREKEGDTDGFYSQVFRKLFAVMCFLVTCLLLGCRILCKLLIDEKFHACYDHMPILLVALLFLCIAQFYGGIYVGKKMSGSLGFSSAMAAVINLAVNLACIRFLGIFAASVSTLVAYFVLAVYRFFSVKKICKITYVPKELLTCLFLLGLSVAAAYVHSPWVSLGLCVPTACIYTVLFWDVLTDLAKSLKKKLKKA